MMIAKKQQNRVVRTASMRKDIVKRHPKEQRPRRWIFVFAVMIFIVGVVYVFFFSHFVTISVIDVQGTQRVDKSDVSRVVEEFLSGDIVRYIKKSNFFLIQESRLIEEIRRDQRIKNVRIEKRFPHTLMIIVEEYDTVQIWCIGDVSGNCYELHEGCITRSVDLSSALILQNDHIIVVDRSRDHAENGQCVISQHDMEKIAYVGKELIYVMDVVIRQPYYIDVRGAREVRFATDESWDIVVSLDRDVSETIEMARLFMKKVSLPIERKDLAYVDLRFTEKIFYNIKDGVEIEKDAAALQGENDEKDEQEKKDEKIKETHD